MNESMSVSLGAKISDFARKMKRAAAITRSFNNNITVRVVARTKKASQKLNSIATTMRSLGEIGSSMIGGVLVSSFSALIPIIAVAGAAVGGLAASFAAAGAGAVAFGVIATSALNDVFKANSKIKDLRKKLANTSDLKERAKLNQQIADEVKGLTGEQRKGLKALQDFGKFWGTFAKQFQKPIMAIFIQSLGTLKGVIKSVKPVFAGSVNAMQGLLDSLDASLKSSDVKSFFEWLGKSAGPAITAFGKIFGNIMKGVMNLLVAFGPLSKTMQGGLVSMTEKFAKWTSTVSKSKGFQNFINYVKTNGPKVLALIGNLVNLIVNLAVAMAPLGAAVLNIVNKIISFTAALVKNHPMVGQIIGILITMIGVIKLIGPPILLMQSLFGGMVGHMLIGMGKLIAKGAVWSAKMIAKFAAMGAKYVWLGIKALASAAKMAASWLIAMGPIGWVTAAVIALAVLIIANWDSIKKWTVKIFGYVSEFLKKCWNGIKAYFTFILNVYKTIFKAAWNAIKYIVMTPVNWIKDKASAAFRGLGNIVSGVWSGIKSGIKNSINGIIGIVNSFIGFMNRIHIHVPSIHIPLVGDVGGFNVGLPNIPKIPKLATGTNYVPNEGLYHLHQGEAVVPKKYNPQNGGVGGGIVVNLSNVTIREEADIDKLANKLADRLAVNARY